jgi:hypothetical protein
MEQQPEVRPIRVSTPPDIIYKKYVPKRRPLPKHLSEYNMEILNK